MAFFTKVATCVLFGAFTITIPGRAFFRSSNMEKPSLLTTESHDSNTVQNNQSVKGVLYGMLIDEESRASLQGAHVSVSTTSPAFESNVMSDSSGHFRFELLPGRYSIKVEHSEYNSELFGDILVGSGKEVFITIPMTESSRVLDGVTVSTDKGKNRNTMAMVSARRLRSQDASRFASGYYDPLKMVTSLPGVSSGNEDDNNQIIVRGNSPKGLLWRLEGIEIPNPNHLAAGEGASGGAYSAITTNILSGFEFYAGAFPAEFGNAISGVMDLSLRTGNPTKAEYSLGVGVVGAEASAEGPLAKNRSGSWFANLRYANFNFLKRYGIIDSDAVSIIPDSFDWGSKI